VLLKSKGRLLVLLTNYGLCWEGSPGMNISLYKGTILNQEIQYYNEDIKTQCHKTFSLSVTTRPNMLAFSSLASLSKSV
jgi:hypothetical protein